LRRIAKIHLDRVDQRFIPAVPCLMLRVSKRNRLSEPVRILRQVQDEALVINVYRSIANELG
ncbi:MAG: hypothetical protein VX090_04030, partial [Pseudomonadota bacterium]|nr:hypothetical protein [Pseudomonadota bacterium]